MNKKIRDLNIEDILFLDIETVRRNNELDVNSKEYELYSWAIRDKTTGFVPPAKEVKAHYKKMAALRPEFNKIVTISVGYIQDRVLYYKALTGTQKEIIEQFYAIVRSRGFKVCGHNIIGFDLPTIRIKAFEEGIDFSLIPENINDTGKKPWDLEKFMFDTMKIITGTYFYSISLDSACMMAGISSSKEDISGPQVSEVYYSEGVDRIAEYCNKDVIATAELFLALQGQPNYIQNYVDRTNQEAQKVEVGVLDHILASGELTSGVVDKIVEFTIEQSLNPENVLTLVKTALSKSREYQKVEEEDYAELKDRLGLTKDYSLIECVVEKGNLGKKQADILIKQYKGTDQAKEVVQLVTDFLTEKKKIGQQRAKEALELIKTEL